MVTRITVPFLDANAIDVTVTAWCKAPGDRVQLGEIVAELTTDKATFELESIGSGTLLEILAAPKSVVPSGYILALLGEPDEADPAAVAYNQALMEKYKSEARGQRPEVSGQPLPPITYHQPPSPATRVRATPRARRLAQEQGIDLVRVQAESGAEVIDEAVLQKYLGKLKTEG